MTHFLHLPFLHLIDMPLVTLTGLLLLSVGLGGLVGWERERHERPAGLRTHILVCVGAALMTLVSNRSAAGADRIAAQIVTGVGFLGAGTIIRDGASGAVRGLTTAASLWAIAGVGIAVGCGGLYAELATISTGIILGTLTLLNRFENALIRQRRRHDLTVVFRASEDPLAAVSRLLESLHAASARTRDLKLERMADTEVAHLQITLSRYTQRDTVDTLLCKTPGLVHYEWGD